MTALLGGDKAQREQAYAELKATEDVAASARRVINALITPLIREGLCADASRVDAVEAKRAALVLGKLLLLLDNSFIAEFVRSSHVAIWAVQGSALGAVLEKPAHELTRDG